MRARRQGGNLTRSQAVRFLSRLGVEQGITWDDLVRVAEDLFGRSIFFVADRTGDLQRRTGLWVARAAYGLVITRAHDDEHYRLVSQLHELAHVLFSYGADSEIQALVGTPASVRACMAGEMAQPAELTIERFVEEVALDVLTSTVVDSVDGGFAVDAEVGSV